MPVSARIYAYRKQLLVFFVLLSAVLLRTVVFTGHPGGLNQDEASIGYDAWSLLNYGVDRNGYSMPVHFLAWGSGQNTLYAYFSMPFIWIFGLNVFSVRCVNLLFGIITVLVIYLLVKKYCGFKTAIIATALTAIAPWHIMLSRWGLESNLFPAMLIISIWLMSKAFEKNLLLPVAAFSFGLCMYAYGSAYVVVSLFCLTSFIYILVKKLIPLRICIISAIIFLLVSLPVYLFVATNLFHWGSLSIGPFSIPETYVSRMTAELGFNLKNTFKYIFELLVLQYDSNNRNSLPVYGCIYLISLPFFIIGAIKLAKTKGEFRLIIFNLMICSFVLFFFYEIPNINRLNAIYLPMIICTAIGLSDILKNKSTAAAAIISYAMFFSGFCFQYFGMEYRNTVAKEFFVSFDKAILKAQEVSENNGTIYVTQRVNMPYIYVLFYTKTNPETYIKTVSFQDPNVQFQQVLSFDRYIFNTEPLRERQKGIYIVDNHEYDYMYSLSNEIYTYENYSVVVVS